MLSPLAEFAFEVVSMYGQSGILLLEDVAPDAPGGQDAENAAGESSDRTECGVRFLRGLSENFPEVSVDFPKRHDTNSGSSGV